METASPRTVLLLITDPLEREQIRQSLAGTPCQFTVVRDAIELLEELRTHEPDLMVLDLMLPKGNLFELLSSLRAEGRLKHSPTIVVSSLGFPEIVDHAIAAGADDFVLKPIDARVFRKRALRLLKLPLRPRPAQEEAPSGA
jgi:PleD family two-component response regulator